MILNCPQCASRFLVADNLIPEAGRDVRCGACSHQWFVNRDASQTEKTTDLSTIGEIPPETPESASVHAASVPPAIANVPALKKRKFPLTPLKIAAPCLAVLWFVLAMVAYFPSLTHLPVLGGMYRMLGARNTEGLAFAEVKMERQDTDTKTRFILSGKIVNHAKESREVPAVHVRMNDRDGHEIWGRDYPVKITLKPEEEYPFRIVNVETSFADRVAALVLDMGNTLELMVR